MSIIVNSGFYVDEDGVTVDISTLPQKGLYAVLEQESEYPTVMICSASEARGGEVVEEANYYHDLFEVKLVLNGFVMKRFEGQDGLFYDKVVKHQENDTVRFDIVEYCSLSSTLTQAEEHIGKLQVVYGHVYYPDEEFDEVEIMRTGVIGEHEDYRSCIDPNSEEGQNLLEYAGVKSGEGSPQLWGDIEEPGCGEGNIHVCP